MPIYINDLLSLYNIKIAIIIFDEYLYIIVLVIKGLIINKVITAEKY